jgi:peptidoglycan/LPS O-acetylase OafA/YrhL
MKENLEYYTFALLQFCPVLFAFLVLLRNRDTQKNKVMNYSIVGSVLGFTIGIIGYFTTCFTYTAQNLNKQLIDVLIVVLLIGSVWLFIFGILMAIFNPNQKKIAVSMIITAIITFIIGFGTCFANFTLGPMH